MQHNPATCDSAMQAANLAGIEPTSVVTGCWVGADQLGIGYAKSNGIPHTNFDLLKQVLPNDIEGVVLLSHKGKTEFDWIVEQCDILGLTCVVW